MKALIGTMFNAPKVVAVRYDGEQTAEEVEEALASWVGSSPARRLIGGGEITNLAGSWCYGTTHMPHVKGCRARGEASFLLASKEDYVKLKDASLHDVKTEQLAREDAANAKSKKNQRVCHYEQDDWRPDEIYLLFMSSDGMRWCKLTVEGKWASIMPETPEAAAKPIKKRRSRKKKTEAPVKPVEDQTDGNEAGELDADVDAPVDDKPALTADVDEEEGGVDKMVDELEVEMDIDYEE